MSRHTARGSSDSSTSLPHKLKLTNLIFLFSLFNAKHSPDRFVTSPSDARTAVAAYATATVVDRVEHIQSLGKIRVSRQHRGFRVTPTAIASGGSVGAAAATINSIKSRPTSSGNGGRQTIVQPIGIGRSGGGVYTTATAAAAQPIIKKINNIRYVYTTK